MPRRPLRKAKETKLRPIRPNAGIEAAYRKKLYRLIDAMQKSVVYWVKAAYRANEPEMAQDAPPDASGFGPEMPRSKSPAMALRDVMNELGRRWQKRFDDLAPEMAKHFTVSVEQRTDAALKSALETSGFSVEFRRSRAMNDIVQAKIGENVSLIKSIPSEYFTDVQGMVMRSVQTGRDLGQLTTDLQDRYGITRRRAETIARDQNNKATSVMERVRQTELGITEAIWNHSSAGKHPRPTHIAMNGKKYDVAKGMWDPAIQKFIFPGEEINCRCFSRSVIPGFS